LSCSVAFLAVWGDLLVLQVSRLVHEDILVLVEVDAILGSVNSV
jgi:hypothetical protein